MTERILVLGALALLLFAQLSITTLLLLLYLFPLRSKLLLLTLTEKLDVLLLKSLIHAALLQLRGLSVALLCHLLVKLAPNESATLLFSQDGLLLFLVVQKGVELLNGGPLVLFRELRVDLGTAISLARRDAILVGSSDPLSA